MCAVRDGRSLVVFESKSLPVPSMSVIGPLMVGTAVKAEGRGSRIGVFKKCQPDFILGS